ncbi:hypothetical protein A2V80_02250 [Candidatus Woesebacteria bacterium RBG_16_39_8b]|uniref:Uncharacterized protein n=1 Tax=Candidatus Woesebacteria bacterium RBG_16_39_8b TaxID=1802482 RepID=A0A1F7XC83_9BACT|nr:MAG: hypothetical protein A2V80_02250 [Candidatus Woesebacteria bacterium RBG_16_39_8b]
MKGERLFMVSKNLTKVEFIAEEFVWSNEEGKPLVTSGLSLRDRSPFSLGTKVASTVKEGEVSITAFKGIGKEIKTHFQSGVNFQRIPRRG